jgi:KTSC domain
MSYTADPIGAQVMRLSRLDLSSVVAIAHSDNQLQLLVNRGEELELLAIPAPEAAFDGLQQLNELVEEVLYIAPQPESIVAMAVDSSMANALGYDEESRVLQIEFANGAIYQYSGVEPETWEELHDTDSIGRYYNAEIKGNYHCDRIYTDEC